VRGYLYKLPTIKLWNGQDSVETRPNLVVTTVYQGVKPVGGLLVPVSKLTVLAPFLALIGLFGVVTAAVAIRKRRA